MLPKYTERELSVKLDVLLTIKKVMFGFNFFIWGAACAAACIGIWFRVDRDFITLIQRIQEADINLTAADIYLGANLLISIGSIIAFVGILGSFSIIKENQYLLILYTFLNFCVFGLYIACAIWGFVKIDYLKGIVSDAMRELFNKAMVEKLQSAYYAVNEIQKQLQCCGNVGPSEYAGDIPPSCSSYVIGCNQAFYDFYWRHTLLLSLLALIFGTCHIIVIALAAYFANEIRLAKRFIAVRREFLQSGANKALLNAPSATVAAN